MQYKHLKTFKLYISKFILRTCLLYVGKNGCMLALTKQTKTPAAEARYPDQFLGSLTVFIATLGKMNDLLVSSVHQRSGRPSEQ